VRQMICFECKGDRLLGSLDEGADATGLLIVSGGNEIRSGAYAGQAAIARHFASKGYPVFRYDRRGVGDSEGANNGFESSGDDLIAAATAFRAATPHLQRIVAFGNCDAATALAFFHTAAGISSLILANPWVIDNAADEQMPLPSAATIRSRYWARLKNPRSLLELLTGKIDLRKLASGLAKAASTDAPTQLSARLANALASTEARIELLIATRDSTAMAFTAAWKSPLFQLVRKRPNIRLHDVETASHSFADATSRRWLYDRIADVLKSPG
jgi:exosortase A-associated hydrolase 1